MTPFPKACGHILGINFILTPNIIVPPAAVIGATIFIHEAKDLS